eukprot:6260866-Pyramimonas_sp.AAC.1
MATDGGAFYSSSGRAPAWSCHQFSAGRRPAQTARDCRGPPRRPRGGAHPRRPRLLAAHGAASPRASA